MPLSVHLDTAPHPLGRPANCAESPSKHSTTVAQSGVAPIWLWATPYRHVLGTTHKVGQRHTDAPIPSLSLRTRSTLAGAPTAIGHSHLHSTATTDPATQHCRPLGG